MRRGIFIAVEGPDGAGKTTLVAALTERLEREGRTVISVREPGGTMAAEAVRGLVLHSPFVWAPVAELFLMLTARADLVANVIQVALTDGSVVLSDRYELSTLAYQVAGRRLPRAAVMGANKLATGGLRPHLTLVLDVSTALGRRRQAAQGKTPDRMEREDAAWHARVARAFRAARGPGIVHIDASQEADAVLAAAWKHVARRVGIPSGRRS